MMAKSAYSQVSALRGDYLHPLGMLVDSGPLRVVRELTFGIVFTGSVQLTNAARLFAQTPHQLEVALDRMSGHLSDANWNHLEWAAAVLAEQARHSDGRQRAGQALCPQDAIPLYHPRRLPRGRSAGGRLLVLGRLSLGC